MLLDVIQFILSPIKSGPFLVIAFAGVTIAFLAHLKTVKFRHRGRHPHSPRQ